MDAFIVAKKNLTGKTFGERLLAAIKNSGLTQLEVAEKTGINRVNLSRYANDKTVPSFEAAAKLADVLGIKLDDLRARET